MAIKWVSPDNQAHHPTVDITSNPGGRVLATLKYENLVICDGMAQSRVHDNPETKWDWVQRSDDIPEDQLDQIAQQIHDQLSRNQVFGNACGFTWKLA